MRLIDGGADPYTVSHLLRRDIDDPSRKARAEALIATALPYMRPAPRIVVSDIDDTVKPFRDPDATGPVFSGARALFRALDLGREGRDTPEVFRRVLAEYGDRVELCMVHHIRGYPVPDEVARDPKVIVFDNYPALARVLYDRGMLSEQQLDDVIHDR